MSDLNYTVSVTWMGYFVDDATHKLLEKLLTNLSRWESIRFASLPHECVHYPHKEAKSLKPKARTTRAEAAPARASANPKDYLRKHDGLSTNSTRLARFKGTAIFRMVTYNIGSPCSKETAPDESLPAADAEGPFGMRWGAIGVAHINVETVPNQNAFSAKHGFVAPIRRTRVRE